VKNVEALQNKVENINTTEIPDYWKTHIDEKISTIKNLHRQYGKDCFSFVLFADTHYPSNLSKISPVLAKRIMDETNIKYALHVGDWQTRGCLATKELLLEENEAIEKMFAPIQDRLLMEQGNHDGSYGWLDRDGDGTYNNSGKAPKDRETYVHNLTPQELHEFAYRKVGTIGDVHFDETGTAYYIDDTSNNVRYIGLNTQQNNYELQADGTQLYPKMWIMRFTQPQFDFLTKEALVEGVKEKTKIVIFAHVPTTQELGDKDVMNGVLRAFVNKTTYSGSYAGEYGYDAVSVNVDFTDVKGTFVGYFHGHTHIDSVNTSNGFNIIGTRCDAKEENTDALKNERVEGTVTEQSFDVFTVTPTKIYATKIGAGVDREISY
jgi:predicted phosphodiesterase